MSRVSIGILGGAVLTAGLVMYGSWNWSLRSESELRLRRAMILEVHDQALRAEVAVGSSQILELMESLRAASNRMDEVKRQLEEEKMTHDPIRHQIEKMQAEQISQKDNLSKREKNIASLNAALETARKTNDELQVQSDGQQNQITKLEAELKGANEREASLRTQLGEAQNSVTSLKAKMDETQRRLVESERLVGEYQKPKQALDTVAATNIAPTVSSP